MTKPGPPGRTRPSYDELIDELDIEITRAGIRGKVTTSCSSDGKQRSRRSRSTRRRQDAAPLPARKIAPRTIGRVYTSPDGKKYRPSMFLTLTCDSYGKVRDDGTPVDPAAMTTPGRRGTRSTSPRCLTGSSRTCAGCSAMRRSTSAGSSRSSAWPRTSTWRSGAACPGRCCARSWRPPTTKSGGPPPTTVRFDGDQLPVWDEGSGNYLDPATGEVLQTWDDALDAIGPADQPRHVARFGAQVRRPGRARRVQGRRPVHRLPDQVPD